MKIIRGLPPELRSQAAELFWAGFGQKLKRPLLGDAEKGKRFVTHMMDSDAMLSAVEDDELLGILMLVDQDHPTKTGEWRGAREIYGLLGGVVRLALVAPLDDKPAPGALHVDWICVAPTARGKGVGAALLRETESVARERGFATVSLSVVDTNSRAKALYERLGFVVTATKSAWPFRWLYGFEKYDEMAKRLA
ncbi:MAG: GNAT family N-acetyltransferase [Actinomycetia bacterium]|nr:GNAT family N-acetyltransferase [Actinomycetes bacterium]